jgi:hypothetical protein
MDNSNLFKLLPATALHIFWDLAPCLTVNGYMVQGMAVLDLVQGGPAPHMAWSVCQGKHGVSEPVLQHSQPWTYCM